MNKVFITRQIPEAGLNILQNEFTVRVNRQERPLQKAELMEEISNATALYCMLVDRIDREVPEAAPDLKVVANMAVGVDNIDIPACTEHGIVVTNTPGVLTEATADLAWALILAVSRRIVEGDRFVREGKFNGWAPLLLVGGDFCGTTLGIIGMGRIGQAVARRSRGFGMQIVYNQRHRLPQEVEEELQATYLPLEDVIRQADYLTLHLPYYPEVHHLLNRERLQLLKPTAYLINTARGAHVDEEVLIEHLRADKIAGAGFDVYEHEPRLSPGLTELENVVLAPHTGSASVWTRRTMAEMCAQNITQVLNGRRPEHVVNPEVYS